MKRSRPNWWLRAGISAMVLAGALFGLSWKLWHLEQERIVQRHEEQNLLEPLRLALWRMDSWLAPRLALENSRSYLEYQSYFPGQRLYNKLLQTLQPGDVLSPSPLLTMESEFIRLHFEIGPDGRFRSPKVPLGNQADLAQGTLLTFDQVAAAGELLARIEQLLASPDARQRLDELPQGAEAVPAPVPVAQSEAEYSKRSSIANTVQQQSVQVDSLAPFFEQTPQEIRTGQLYPVWILDGQPELFYLRSVDLPAGRLVQGFLADWTRLQVDLLAQIEDLFADAQLHPVLDINPEPEGPSRRLATLPATLEVTVGGSSGTVWTTPTGTMLIVTWILVLLVLASGAQTLKATIAFGEQRSRFASSVTHELRTPLTTLQMYSEMLADGLVTDPVKQQEFQATVRNEAVRLANLVENVLSYSRLEEGRSRIDTRRITCGELIESAHPGLEWRAESAGMTLKVNVGPAAEACLRVNSDVVAQILSNLVDNACKYAAEAEVKEIEIACEIRASRLRISVVDHGPGISAEARSRIFRAFERGDAPGGPAKAGVGLGLSLSRALAREMGGELLLEEGDGPGCRFCVVLPVCGE